MKTNISKSETLKKSWIKRREKYGPTGVRNPDEWIESIKEGMRKPGAKTNDNEKAWVTRRELYGPFGMKKITDRKKYIEIERKLKVTIFLPQICYFCDEEITHKGNDKDSLVIHSLDGDHDNWDPTNKAPAHRRCHVGYHVSNSSEETRKKMGVSSIGPENNRKGWINRRQKYGPTGRKTR